MSTDIFRDNQYVAFIFANARASNPFHNMPVIHQEGTRLAWTPFGIVHFHVNRTKQQILADLVDVLSNDNDLSTANKSMAYWCVEEALDAAEWNKNKQEEEEEEEEEEVGSLAGEEEEDNDSKYLPPLCSNIRDKLNSRAETQEDKELSQLVSYKHNFDMWTAQKAAETNTPWLVIII